MTDRIKYKKKYKESVKPLGIGDPLVGAGLAGLVSGGLALGMAKGFHDLGEKRKAQIKKRTDMIKASEDRKKESNKRILNVQQKHKAARYKNVKAKKRSY
jgi:hypothetical protein